MSFIKSTHVSRVWWIALYWILSTGFTFSQTVPLSEEEQRWIAENPVITATNNMDLVPLDFVNDGEPYGFAVDYLNIVTKNVGLQIKFENNQSWKSLLDQVKNKKIDIAHSLMRNPARDEFLNFTEPYLNIPIVNFGRKGSPRVNSINDLANLRIGVIQGWAITDYYRKNHPEFTLVEYTAIRDALNGLSNNEVDVVTGSRYTLEYFISQNFMNDIEIIGDDYAFNSNNVVEHRIATHKEEPILRDILQKGMNAVTEEQLKQISEKWRIEETTFSKINFTKEELDWISSHKTITATNKMEMAPIDFVQGGVATGFSVDYLNMLADKIGIEINYVNGQPWDVLIDQIKEKKIDITHTVVETPGRAEFMTFSQPYLNIPWVYFGRTGSDPINSIDDLNGKKIGLVERSHPWDIYTSNYSHLNIVSYKSPTNALNDLANGTIDVYVNLVPTTNYIINRNLLSGIEVIGRKFFPEEYGLSQFRIGVRNDWPVFSSIIDKAMNEVTEEEFNNLISKWRARVNNELNINLSEDEQYWIRNNKVRIVVDGTGAAPFEFIDENGNLSGISGEILNLISDALNLDIEIVETSSWDQALSQVRSDNSHVIPTIIRTPEREQDIIFTNPYYLETNMIFSLKENIEFQKLENLRGFKIAQIGNDARVEFIRNQYPDIEIVEVDSADQALQMVADRQVDAYIGILSRTQRYLLTHNITNISVVGETPIKTELSIGIGANYPLLANAFNKALAAIPEGDKQRIIQKWMAVQIVPEMDYDIIWQILAISTLILAFILYWNNKLRKEVIRRIEIEKSLKIEQQKTMAALKENKTQVLELQFQRETIERSAEAQAELMDNLAIMADDAESKNKLLTEIMNNTGHGIVVFSKELKLQAWNDTFKEIMDLNDRKYEEQMDLKKFFELNLEFDENYEMSIDEYIIELQKRIKNRKECNEYSWDREKRNGNIINTIQRIMEDGTIINTYKDVTEERKEEKLIREMALTDGLTGLANRRAFDVTMENAVEQYRKTNKQFLLAYMDLDNFKTLNDTQGHKAGDLVLTHVANIIRDNIRENDIPARLGGDEFAVIFQDSNDLEAAAKRLEQIILEVKNTHEIEGYKINVGASAGLALCTDSDISASEMVEIADKALYTAKENGKGQVFKKLSA